MSIVGMQSQSVAIVQDTTACRTVCSFTVTNRHLLNYRVFLAWHLSPGQLANIKVSAIPVLLLLPCLLLPIREPGYRFVP